MSERVDFYGAYRQFTDGLPGQIRRETFGEDIGQNSWLTVDEYDRFIGWLALEPGHDVLEVASGSGGPALHLTRTTGCRVIGIDSNASGVATASRLAADARLGERARFVEADAGTALPFESEAFDAILCIDAMNHLPERAAVLAEWRRLLRPGGRALFTDPVVITGPVRNDELALRSSIGVFLFVPPGVNERLVEEAGLHLARVEDVTENAAMVSERWHRARVAHRDALVASEGAERFEGVQRFLESVHRLTRERRLSRIAYLLERKAG
ncbi:MAG TPA: methyltransferase domain-containing protein [Candidatus Eisenbacteria bacterium]|nr:methyltransferase domain-containing protein [Candidatus Eisenbacteria bacterium]